MLIVNKFTLIIIALEQFRRFQAVLNQNLLFLNSVDPSIPSLFLLQVLAKNLLARKIKIFGQGSLLR